MAETHAPQNVDNLWFSPDMVVLRAKSRKFQVFAAILKAQSSVFADMFALPQPPSTLECEKIDGVPVVDVHDNPDELQTFLKAIFDSSFFMPPPAAADFNSKIAILRLSNKYDVPYLRRRALQHLDAIFPTDLEGYDARGRSLNAKSSSEHWLSCIATIQAATEVGALWLLPVAYYDVCKRSIETLLSNPKWNALPIKERHASLIGHSAQIQAHPGIIQFFGVEVDGCDDPAECYRVRNDLAAAVAATDMTWPLEAHTQEGLWAGWATAGVCEACIEEAKALHVEARKDLWDRLPAIFGLPGWDTLKGLRQTQLFG